MLQGWPESFDILTTSRDGTLTSSSRQRTSQACDKCRERKTKCSGDHPVCKRCTTRGLICTYSCREPRSRGPTRPRARAASTIELPTVTMPAPFFGAPSVYRGAAEPPRQQQHYRTASVRQQQQQQQGALQARVQPAKTDSLLTDVPGSPSRQHMSHDFGQVRVQSKRLVPPMARDAGQIKPMVTAGKAEGSVNFCVPLGGASGGLAMPSHHVPATPIAGSLAFKNAGGMRYMDRTTPPSLSHSTSTSVTHSPSSSEYSLEAHYQSISNFELLMASYADATLYEYPLDAALLFGSSSLEPAAIIQPCFKEEASTSRRDASLELLSPTPITPIGMGKLETALDMAK